MERSCLNCKEPHLFSPRVKNQQYCSKPQCQRSRKALWQRMKMQRDEDYRKNQHNAQQTWKSKNPDYWRKYRSANEAYRQREQQRQDLRRHPQILVPPVQSTSQPCLFPVEQPSLQHPHVAKMDASTPIKTGTYIIQPVGVAKMDAIVVQLIVMQEEPRPQDRTRGREEGFGGTLLVTQDNTAACTTLTLPEQHNGDDSGRSSIDRNSLGRSAPCQPAPT
jgi:hypothetical protein